MLGFAKQVWAIWKPLVTSRQHTALLLVVALSIGWRYAFPHDMRPLYIGAVAFTLLLVMYVLYRRALLRLRTSAGMSETGSVTLMKSIGLGGRNCGAGGGVLLLCL